MAFCFILLQQCVCSLLLISHLLSVLALPKIGILYYNLTLTDWKICDLEPESSPGVWVRPEFGEVPGLEI